MTSPDTHAGPRSTTPPPAALAPKLDAAADAILDSLRWTPLPVEAPDDLVIVPPAWCPCARASLNAGRPSGWGPPQVVPIAHRRLALCLLGIPPHQHAELLGEAPKPGYVYAVVVVAGYLVPRQIRLRHMQCGGAA